MRRLGGRSQRLRRVIQQLSWAIDQNARVDYRWAGAIAARTKPRFIEIPRERGGCKVPFTDERLAAIRGGSDRGGI